MKIKDKILFLIENRGAIEDIFLYSTLAIAIGFGSWFLFTTQQSFEQGLSDSDTTLVFFEHLDKEQATLSSGPSAQNVVGVQKVPNNGQNVGLGKFDKNYLAYLQAQANLNKHRYKLGGKILVSNATRKNIGFLIGMLLALIGCIVIVRRIRNMDFTAEGAAAGHQFKILTASPGVLLAVLGSAIIMTTIIATDKVEVKDYEPKLHLSITVNKPLTKEEQGILTEGFADAIKENESSELTNNPKETKK